MITFDIPGRAPASYSGNGRASWQRKAREGAAARQTAQILAQAATPPGFAPQQHMHVTMTQRAVSLRDADNWIASCKPYLDGLKDAGIILDDTQEHVTVEYRHEPVKHRVDERVSVEVR